MHGQQNVKTKSKINEAYWTSVDVFDKYGWAAAVKYMFLLLFQNTDCGGS